MNNKKLFSQELQDTLGQMFGIRSSFEFQLEIKRSNFQAASQWLKYIEENKVNFPNCTDEWFKQRKLELFDGDIG